MNGVDTGYIYIQIEKQEYSNLPYSNYCSYNYLL